MIYLWRLIFAYRWKEKVAFGFGQAHPELNGAHRITHTYRERESGRCPDGALQSNTRVATPGGVESVRCEIPRSFVPSKRTVAVTYFRSRSDSKLRGFPFITPRPSITRRRRRFIVTQPNNLSLQITFPDLCAHPRQRGSVSALPLPLERAHMGGGGVVRTC